MLTVQGLHETEELLNFLVNMWFYYTWWWYNITIKEVSSVLAKASKLGLRKNAKSHVSMTRDSAISFLIEKILRV